MQCVALNLRIVTHLQKGCGCVGWKMIFDLVLDEASPSHCQHVYHFPQEKEKWLLQINFYILQGLMHQKTLSELSGISYRRFSSR